ncbi:MAG: 50S ribosomal protein L15 [Alphaproteobacteria bacterium]|nr:50S ribosomal protein L15 [Alphaproteobacteria bacterium]
MRLNEITENEGAAKRRVRVGRGIGSGLGKTGGRGVKGQKSRTGVAIKGFEGGQMPLYRRLPKRGFSKWRRKEFNTLNLGALQEAIDAGRIDAAQPHDVASLTAAGVLRRAKDGLRILGQGELKSKITLTADHATASAKAAIEKIGGTLNIVEKKVLADDVAKRDKTAAKKAAKS